MRWQAEDIQTVSDKVSPFERGLLLASLGTAEGALPFEFLSVRAVESKTPGERVGAIAGLLYRFGPAAQDAMGSALEDSSSEVRNFAAIALAEVATPDSNTAQFYAWFGHRMGRSGRLESWDPRELPSAIEFAVRTQSAAALTEIVRKWEANLSNEERTRLATFEPNLLDHSIEVGLIELSASEDLFATLRSWRNEHGNPTERNDHALIEIVDEVMEKHLSHGRGDGPGAPQ